jgi:hypothetical protein
MRNRLSVVSLCGVLVASCGDQPLEPASLSSDVDGIAVAAARSGPPMSVTVEFGRNALGTDFFPPGEHDASFHAKDAIRPRAIVIAAGGTVDFVVASFHKPALYEPGIEPEDIDTSLLEDAGAPFPFPPVINDPAGRIARRPLNLGAPVVWSQTFPEPGRYLVICEVLPHFAVAKMYAWVVVK